MLVKKNKQKEITTKNKRWVIPAEAIFQDYFLHEVTIGIILYCTVAVAEMVRESKDHKMLEEKQLVS